MNRHPELAQTHTDALVWVNQQLVARNLAPVSELQLVREMAWSVVARVEHEQGVWYFKHLPERFRQELVITEYLSAVDPTHIVRFVAKDEARGYLLVEDAGPMLRERYEEQLDPTMWFEALDAYARLQIKVMGAPELNRLPNRSLAKLPELILPNLAAFEALNGDDVEEHCLPEHRQQVEAALVNWPRMVAPLYQHGIGDTLHHGDLHDGNLAYTDKAVMFDWGDASLSHPFMSFRSVSISIERRFNITVDSADIAPFRDAYLGPWQQFASIGELRTMFTRASKVWALVSLLSWQWAVYPSTDPRATRYHFALPALLREFCDVQ